jgi:6-hydroxytryprostatin B O-methyltransferase
MTNRMFYEPSSNQIAHTATSAVVVKQPLLKALIGHCIEEVGAASVKLVESMDKYGDSQDPGQAAICLAFGLKEGGNCFTLFEEDGEGDMKGWRARRFGEAMRSLTSGGMYSTKHVHGGFDWQSLGNGTVVDVCLGSTT